MNQAQDFLSALFGDVPDGLSILIWTRQDKQSHWIKKTSAVNKLVRTYTDSSDLYFGVCLHDVSAVVNEAQKQEEKKAAEDNRDPRKRTPSDTRGFMTTAKAIGALHVDIDIAGPTHSGKKKLVPNQEQALKLLEACPIKPSIIVSSGGGLQAWWVFSELWVLTDEDQRKNAAELSLRWNNLWKMYAQAAGGYEIDSTHDLARVMRVPGTQNLKAVQAGKEQQPYQVKIISPDPFQFLSIARYEISQLAELADEAKGFSNPSTHSSATQSGETNSGDFILREDAQPPFDKFNALIEIDPKFKASWERKRRDLKDQSASSYCMSLAAFAAYVGWGDQEIVDLLVAWRRKHGEDLKLNRRDVYGTYTLKRAREQAQRRQALEKLNDREETAEPVAEPLSPRLADRMGESDKGSNGNGNGAHHSPASTSARQKIINRISDAIGTRIVKIIKYDQDPPRYRLFSTKGQIELGTVGNLIEQTPFRHAVAAAEGLYIPKFSAKDWDNLAQALLDCVEVVTTGPEGTDRGAVASWLAFYLDENPPGELNSETLSAQSPYIEKSKPGKVFFFGSHFRDFVFRRCNEKISGKRMGVLLRDFGCDSDIVSVHVPGRPTNTTRNVWAVSVDDNMIINIPDQPVPEDASKQN